MRILTLFFALLLSMPIAASTASAQPHFTTGGYKFYSVRANRTTAVSYHVQSNGHCHMHYRTSVVITHPPSHGKIWYRKMKKRIPYNHPDRRCRGKYLHVIKVYYKPNRGYRGRDAFGYQLTGLSTDKRTGPRHFSIKVR